MIVSTEAELPLGEKRSLPPALFALAAPEEGMARQAKVGKWGLPLLIAFVCSALAGSMQAIRVDAHDSTMQKMEMMGQLQTMSDRQIQEETTQAERIAQVKHVAIGVLQAPILMLLTALAVVALCWFLRGKISGRAVMPVAAAVLLPGAIANLLDGIAAFQHAMLPPDGVPLAPRNLNALLLAVGHPLMPPWVKLGNALDFFSLWAAVLLGYGVAATGNIPVKRALIGTLVAWVAFRLLTNVAGG